MRFVPIKTPDEQAACMVLRTRELFVRQRSQTANTMRAHMAELGIITAAGMTSIAKLILILRDTDDARLPATDRAALLEMARVEKLDTKIVAAVKADEIARRLAGILDVGSIIAATVRAAIQYPAAFKTSRDLAAWIGITPRANGRDQAARCQMRDEPEGRHLDPIRPSDSVRLRAREFD